MENRELAPQNVVSKFNVLLLHTNNIKRINHNK